MTDHQAALRQEVWLLRSRESRRIFDATVAIGRLGGERQRFVVRAQDLPAIDASLRTDVMTSLLEQSEVSPVAGWLIRSGSPTLHDEDLHWLAAATSSFGIHARPLGGFHAITRSGWLDVRSGESKLWCRLRL
ncbi:MAG TPA: hypothetical protein VFD59_11935 [Nocardioidaceae bacterium]|nr:hypothetical protein [Nocardioidaceae bacterium]